MGRLSDMRAGVSRSAKKRQKTTEQNVPQSEPPTPVEIISAYGEVELRFGFKHTHDKHFRMLCYNNILNEFKARIFFCDHKDNYRWVNKNSNGIATATCEEALQKASSQGRLGRAEDRKTRREEAHDGSRRS